MCLTCLYFYKRASRQYVYSRTAIFVSSQDSPAAVERRFKYGGVALKKAMVDMVVVCSQPLTQTAYFRQFTGVAGGDGDFDYSTVVAPLLVLSSCV